MGGKTASEVGQWAYWNAALAGEDTSQFHVADGVVWGWYGHDRHFRRIAIYQKTSGEWVGSIDGKSVSDPAALFAAQIRVDHPGTPVSYEMFKAHRDGQALFPGEEEYRAKEAGQKRARSAVKAVELEAATTPAAGHNLGASDAPAQALALFEEEVRELARMVEQAQKGLDPAQVASADTYALFSGFAARALDLSQQADKARKVESEPLHKAWKAKNEEWKPVIDKASKLQGVAKQMTLPYLKAKEAAERAAQAKIDANREAMAKAGIAPTRWAPTIKGGTSLVKREVAVVTGDDDLRAFYDWVLKRKDIPNELYVVATEIAMTFHVAGIENIPGITFRIEESVRSN